MSELPPPTGEPFYYITPEEGGASDLEAMWLAEDYWAESIEGVSQLDSPPRTQWGHRSRLRTAPHNTTHTRTTRRSPMAKGLAMNVITDDDGTRYELTEFEGGLAELQAAVGGWIEAAPSSDNVTIWINEEGKLHGLPINRFAMDVWIKYDQYRCMLAGDWLAGNAVITGGVDAEGETMDLADVDRAWVRRVAREAIR